MKNQERLQIEYVKVSDLIPYDKNPRKNDPAVDAVAASIKNFGFKIPIVIDEQGVLVCGHTRTKAAKKLGIEEVPCIRATDLTPEQIRAFRIADNKVAELAEWDDALLGEEIAALPEFNFEEFGFDLDEITPEGEVDTKEDEFDVDAEPEVIDVKMGEVWKCGEHRLMIGDSTKEEDVKRLMGRDQADLVITDPPYNVAYEGNDGMTIKNDDMEDAQFRAFLKAAFTSMNSVLKPGGAFYIWHADSEGYNFRGACHDVGLTVRQCLIWKKNSLVLGRQDYQWIHEPCQPAGTMIRVPGGEKPIEEIVDGDRVVSFDTYSGALKGLRDGLEVQTASRMYDGNLYGVNVAGRKTWATDNHQFSVRFNPDAKNRYCTYLMRRGSWWRVGHTRSYDARQFGIKTRLHQEKADEAWIIGSFDSRSDAQVAEQIIACTYGIPYTHWETERGIVNSKSNHRTVEQIEKIYSGMDLDELERNAHRLLADYGRSERFPLVTSESKHVKFSTRVTCRINACNLVHGIMELPIPRGGYGEKDGRLFDWIPIESVERKPYSGRVYSLAVAKWEHYIADGIITHNCLYGWKEGASHVWYADRSQTTVMDFEKPRKSDLHPTMKPLALFAYQMQNSSKPGDVVLDLFGGSGTTMICAERAGRRARLMEFDPTYAQRIINRWEEESGKKAVKVIEADGTPVEIDDDEGEESPENAE